MSKTAQACAMGVAARAFAGLLLAAVASAWATDGAALHVLAAEIRPMAFIDSAGRPDGFCVQLVAELQRRLGVAATPVQFMPWARAHQMVQQEGDVVVTCPKRTPEREGKFKFVGPVLQSQTNLYTLAGNGARPRDLHEARRASGILVPHDSYSQAFLQKAGFQNLEPASSSATMLRMLVAGRKPLMVIDREELPSLLKEEQLPAGTVHSVLAVVSTRSYLMFSLKTADAVVARWQAALDAMKKDGSFARLHQQWYPQEPLDWVR